MEERHIEETDWPALLQEATFVCNSYVDASTGYSPNEVMYSARLRCNADAVKRKRILVKTLLDNSNLSVKEISRKIGESIATVYRIKSRKVNHIGLKHHKGAGGPSILRKSIRRSLTQQTRRKNYLSVRTLAHLVPGKPSHETVWRAMKDLDYSKSYPDKKPLVNEKNRLVRVKWARSTSTPKNPGTKQFSLTRCRSDLLGEE